jgi:hypothetical protein
LAPFSGHKPNVGRAAVKIIADADWGPEATLFGPYKTKLRERFNFEQAIHDLGGRITVC